MKPHQQESDIEWRHAYVIAVVGPKGGVGKTFVATNLAVGLARANPENKVALIDCHPQTGDVGTFLNLTGTTSIFQFDDQIDTHAGSLQELIASTFVKHQTGISVLCGAQDHFRKAIDVRKSRHSVSRIAKYFDYAVLDIPAIMHEWILSDYVMFRSHCTVVITRPTLPALRSTALLLNLLDERLRDQQEVIVTLNQIDEENSVSEDIIPEYLEKHPALIKIPVDADVIRSVNEGKPLLELTSDKHSPAAVTLQELTQLIMKQLPPDAIQQIQAKFKPREEKVSNVPYAKKTVARTTEEAIYAALIEQVAQDWPYLVVSNYTRPFRSIVHFNPKDYPLLQHETYENYMLVNQKRQLLSTSLDLGLPYDLFSDQDWKELGGYGGYHAFFNVFPDAPGIISFSRVGLNERQDQALASWGRIWGIRAGGGFLQMLERQSERWVVAETLMSWVS